MPQLSFNINESTAQRIVAVTNTMPDPKTGQRPAADATPAQQWAHARTILKGTMINFVRGVEMSQPDSTLDAGFD